MSDHANRRGMHRGQGAKAREPFAAPAVRRAVKHTPPCQRCRYPLVPSDKACPRCVWEGRADA